MTRTRTFEARLPNGDRRNVECRWCPDARWYKGRVEGHSVYFDRNGVQV